MFYILSRYNFCFILFFSSNLLGKKKKKRKEHDEEEKSREKKKWKSFFGPVLVRCCWPVKFTFTAKYEEVFLDEI